MLELEVLTPDLVDRRNLLLAQDSQLTRLKWLQTERTFGKHADRPLPKWTSEYNGSPTKLHKEIQLYESLVPETKRSVEVLEQNLGGTLVFCDLAGNEYAADSKNSTKAELEEAAGFNRSLLAVKAMIRGLHVQNQSNKHVPYRDSKLTMMLGRHLDTKAVMLSRISPSQESLKKTINTLTYSFMVGQTNENSTSSAPANKKGKENKPKSLPVKGFEGYHQSVDL